MADNIGERLSKLEERVDNAEAYVESVSKRLELLAAAVSDSKKTQWQPLLAVIGIVLTLGSYAGSFYVRDLGKFEKALEKVENRGQVDPRIYREDYREIVHRLRKLEDELAKRTGIVNEFARLRDRIETCDGGPPGTSTDKRH